MRLKESTRPAGAASTLEWGCTSRVDAAAVRDAIEAYEARYGMYPSSVRIFSLSAHATEEVEMSCGLVSVE